MIQAQDMMLDFTKHKWLVEILKRGDPRDVTRWASSATVQSHGRYPGDLNLVLLDLFVGYSPV